MAFSLTVNGVETEILIERGTLNINASLYGRGSMVGHFLSEDGSLTIDLEDEIILALDAVRLFRGTVARAKLRGADGAGGDGNDSIVWEVLANDSSWPLDYRVLTETIAEGTTLKAALERLMEYVPELTLAAGQATGPNIPEIVFTRTKARDAFNRIISEAIAADAPGWFLRITHTEELEAVAPGASPAAWDLVEGDGSECGDLESDDRREDDYATRVIVEGGIVTQFDRVESFTGDGSTVRFPLLYTPFATRGYVRNGSAGGFPVNETLGASPALWEIDTATNELVKVSGGAPALGDPVEIRFDGTLDIYGDTGETSPPSTRTVIEQVDGLSTLAEAQNAAERLLAELSADQKKITFPTRRHGLRVGDKQMVTSAKRKIPTPTPYYVNEIVITYDGATEGDGLLYEVESAVSQIVKGNFRETYRTWALLGQSAPAPQPPPSTVVTSGGGVTTAPTSLSGTLIGVRRITATGAFTYTPSAGTNTIIVELQGAGGGGSGIASAGSGNVSIGRSGGGGGWLRKRLTSDFSGATGSVGAKGTGGSAGDNPGNAGGDTTFTTTAPSSTTYTGGGGSAGNNGGSGLTVFPNISNGVGGGSASGGDDNMPGSGSFAGVVSSNTILNSGGGGYSRYGHGGYGSLVVAANSSQAAFNATGKGGGGGSPVSTGTAGALAGGDGSDGMVIIWEYR